VLQVQSHLQQPLFLGVASSELPPRGRRKLSGSAPQMIVDDLKAASPILRILSPLHVFRVPWQVSPRYGPYHDSIRNLNGLQFEWTKPFPNTMIPRTKDGRAIDSSWWKPPYQAMMVASESAEDGALFIWARSSDFEQNPLVLQNSLVIDETPDQQPICGKPDWAAYVGILVHYRGRIVIVVATQIYSVGGTLHDVSITRPSATRKMYEILNGFERDSCMAVEEELQRDWTIHSKEHKVDVEHLLATFSTTMALLSCKNISTDVVNPPHSLQVRRKARGNLPLVSYRILKVGARRVRDKADASSAAGTGQPLALHWVRGHFKTFTEDAPLLGRAVGTYWWSPHTAGKADRVVIKDYALKEEKP
jgi:hypothetical protein